ncbi:MAG TPA: BCAM0308 family protein [bacterium]|nr:BCAM0308 family protein [bacterium]
MIASPTEPRKDRLIHERIHDPYKSLQKPVGSSVCPVCNAVFKDGHWQWLEFWPLDTPREICQACRRIRDNYPAGFMTITGEFVQTHRQEVLNLARNQERAECALHPLHRIIHIEEQADAVTITTTDLHLPKRIGQALERAYKGRLDLHYDEKGCFVRVKWTSPKNKLNHPTMKRRQL